MTYNSVDVEYAIWMPHTYSVAETKFLSSHCCYVASLLLKPRYFACTPAMWPMSFPTHISCVPSLPLMLLKWLCFSLYHSNVAWVVLKLRHFSGICTIWQCCSIIHVALAVPQPESKTYCHTMFLITILLPYAMRIAKAALVFIHPCNGAKMSVYQRCICHVAAAELRCCWINVVFTPSLSCDMRVSEAALCFCHPCNVA